MRKPAFLSFIAGLCAMMLAAADYPQDISVLVSGFVTSDVFLVSHNSDGTEKAAHFDSIDGNVLPDTNNTRNIGSSSLNWLRAYIDILTSNEIEGTGAFQIQASGNGNATMFEDQTSATQRQFQVHGPNSAAYVWLQHDATDAKLDASSGKLRLQDAGVGDVVLFDNDASGQQYIRAYGPGSAANIAIGHNATDALFDTSSGVLRFKDSITLDTGGSGDIVSTQQLTLDDFRVGFAVPLTVDDTAGGHTHDDTWSVNLSTDHQGIFNALNYLADNIGGAATLQGAYDNSGTPASISMASLKSIEIDLQGAGSGGDFRLTNVDDQHNLVLAGVNYDVNPLERAELYFDSSDDSFWVVNQSGGTIGFSHNGGYFKVHSTASNNLTGTIGGTNQLLFRFGTAIVESAYGAEISTAGASNKDLAIAPDGDLLLKANAVSSNTIVTAVGSTTINSGSVTRVNSGTGNIFVSAIDGTGLGELHIGNSTGDPTHAVFNGRVKFSAADTQGSSSFSSATTKEVSNTSVTAGCIVIVTPTSQPAGRWWVTKTAGSSFTVNSTATETSTTFDWIMIQ